MGSAGHEIDEITKAAIEDAAVPKAAPSSELETQLVAVGAALPGVICSYRQTADGKRTFPYASENCSDVYGLSPRELQISADAVFQRLHPDDLPHVLSTVEEFC